MQVKKLLTDDEGVSPVIGVILMVAITVILAAVIAAFVLGIGDTEDPAPSSSIEYELTSNSSELYLEATHDSGDSFTAEDVQLNLDDGSESTSDGTTLDEVASIGPQDEFGPGDTLEFTNASTDGSTPLWEAGSTDELTIEFVWAPGGGDAQSVFSSDTFTNADVDLVNVP